MGREVGHRVFTCAIGLGGERHSWSAGVDSLEFEDAGDT
jgi:hypothetical protein